MYEKGLLKEGEPARAAKTVHDLQEELFSTFGNLTPNMSFLLDYVQVVTIQQQKNDWNVYFIVIQYHLAANPTNIRELVDCTYQAHHTIASKH